MRTSMLRMLLNAAPGRFRQASADTQRDTRLHRRPDILVDVRLDTDVLLDAPVNVKLYTLFAVPSGRQERRFTRRSTRSSKRRLTCLNTQHFTLQRGCQSTRNLFVITHL